MIEQICNYGIVVNEFFHAQFASERGRPDFSGREAWARIPLQIRGDMPVTRRARRGLGSTPSRIPVSSPKINNKIKTFVPDDKKFLTIYPDYLAANECCEPRK
jgi:hypothetical protein